MNGFSDKDGVLHAGTVPLPRIAGQFGTPAYVYSADGIRETVRGLQAAFANALPADAQPMIAFACKANSNLAVLKLMANLGLGCDVVSGGELERALGAGIPAKKIVYSGVGKSAAEIRRALDAGIFQFNVESAPEMDRIAVIAAEMGKAAPVALRFNPDVEAGTHAKITTGKEHNKFGLPRAEIMRLYAKAAATPSLNPVGLSMHIGSQLTSIEPYRQAFMKLAALANELRAVGLAVERLDLGGGIGVVYKDEKPLDLNAYAALVREIIHPLGARIVLEPGRMLVAGSGVLLARVEYMKRTEARRYVILDAGMNDLVRPAMYDAWHNIRPVEAKAGEQTPCDIVGPVCETGDTFALDRMMPPLSEGDLVAVMTAGAYGFAMASAYNTRPLPPEILVDGDRVALVRQRQSVRAILNDETIPAWLD
jgi:diaminopimelate decarboxylase